MSRASLVILLHAHLPWVRHPELPFFHEERWLFEAIVETYLPLIESFRRLEDEGVPARVAIDVSPTLASMLTDELLQERASDHLSKLEELVELEVERTAEDEAFAPVVEFYRERLARLRKLFEDELQRDVTRELARLESAGLLELATCAATHPILPFIVDQPPLVRTQIRTAVREHQRIFGRPPRGIWLPECAYAPQVDRFLAEADLRWFVVDAHGLETARPRPRFGVHAPALTEYGVAVFARDVEPARQVWSAEAGYPGDPAYREFYRDVGWDLPLDYVKPYVDPNGDRMFTGLKYYRITDRSGEERLPYDPELAAAKVNEHAGHFFDKRVEQAMKLATEHGRPPVIVCPYDAELFGHWWFEGPSFIELVLRKMAFDQKVLDTRTPSDILAESPLLEVVSLEPSTWGSGGYFEVWIDEKNEWCLPHLHGVGTRLLELVRRHRGESERSDRLLRQAAREAMLAQSSDWGFLMSTGTAESYARRRFLEHVQRFNRLDEMLVSGEVDEEFVSLCEERDGLFPDLVLTDLV